MKASNKQTAAKAYFASMCFDIEKQPQRERQKPQRIEGGCLLYTLKNNRSQQHPPAPYYS